MTKRKKKIPSGLRPESTYYCRKCNSHHRIGSKIGREHFEYFSHWIIAL